MFNRLTLFITFGGLFVTTVRCGTTAQGGASLAGSVAGTQNNDDKEIRLQSIQDIFGPPPVQSTSVPVVESCTCVPYFLCNNGTINTNGEGIIDIRSPILVSPDRNKLHNKYKYGNCESYFEVCCNKADLTEEKITPALIPKKKTGCGFHHPNGVGFRISDNENEGDIGNEAQFGEFPWMVAVMEPVASPTGEQNVYRCGGALIHPQVVVTAAHCVTGINKKFKIRAGEWDTQHTLEIHPHQDGEVQTIVAHPEYYSGALYNNVALLYLQSPLESAEHIETICLPPQGTITSTGLCYATGWGKDVFGQKGKYQAILKKIDLPVVPNAECQAKLRSTKLGKFFELHKSFICAGGEPGKDTCYGDGGGPLVCPIPGKAGRYYQAGIVAWGMGCGENNIPGVYVNLPLFRDWIDSQMKSFGLGSSSYDY